MPPESVDLLIEARWVLPIAPVNTVLADHAVAVTAGRIVAIGPCEQMRERFEPRERVVRAGHALLPGFVNAHTSAAMTLLRGLPVRGPRARWWRETVLPAEQRHMGADFVRDGTQLAIAEMLRAGITSFSDRYLFPEEAARSASAARVRAAIGLPIADGPTAWAESSTAHFDKAERLWDEYKSDPWICLYFAPQAGTEVSDATLSRVRRIADELDARVAMEVRTADSPMQQNASSPDRRPLQRLEELGLLRPGFSAIHLNDATEEDLLTVARTGISVIACTQSNLRLGSNPCPIGQLDRQRTAVGLGTEDPVSAGALDILAEARLAALVANTLRRGDDCSSDERHSVQADNGLTATDVLRMATLGGATALGLASLIGSIEPGKAADLVCFDLGTQVLPAAGSPPEYPADVLLFAATRQQASDVWTSGRAAVSAGRLLTFDEQELSALKHRWSERRTTGATS